MRQDEVDLLAVGPLTGGVGHVFDRAVSALAERGVRVRSLALSAGERTEAGAALRAALSVRAELREAPNVHVELGSNDLVVMWFAAFVCLLRRDVVVVAHDVPKLALHPGVGVLRRTTRLRTIVAHRLLSPLVSPLLRTVVLRRAGAWLVLGDDAVAAWRAKVRAPVSRLHLAVDTPDDPGPAPSRGRHVLFAGFLGPTKGLDLLLDAWEEAARLDDPPLVIAGAEDAQGWAADLRARSGAMEPAPQWLGAVDEDAFAALFRDAALFVMPYRWSSAASGVLVRALAAGRPVLATRVPAIEGLVRDGVEGRVVEDADAGRLAAALRGLLDDPAGLDRMGRAARARAEAELSWSRHVNDLQATYAAVRVNAERG